MDRSIQAALSFPPVKSRVGFIPCSFLSRALSLSALFARGRGSLSSCFSRSPPSTGADCCGLRSGQVSGSGRVRAAAGKLRGDGTAACLSARQGTSEAKRPMTMIEQL